LSSLQILICDDYADWRRQIRSALQKRPEWQVDSEASDGLEAVQKAQDLNPDIILLDVGLPKLNGIEAARRMRQLSPNSKIIFLSQNKDRDIVQAALSIGVGGYVHKPDLKRELVRAIDAVVRGEQFVSTSLSGHQLTDFPMEKATHRHEVQFYSDDALFLDTLARFIAVALKSGRAAIVIVTQSHLEVLVSRLEAEGLDLDAAAQRGTYIPLDVSKTFSTFMVNDMPDATRFFPMAGALIQAAAKAARQQHRGVVVCGEGTSVLWADGKANAAIRVEQLWNEIGKTLGVDILCGYASSSFHSEEDKCVLRSICAEHSAVYSQ
jgi:DNA-binding NarL/FixJ family response regulator